MTLIDTLTSHPPPLRQTEEGTIRIADTRVSLDTVIAAYQNGVCPEEITRKFPTLALVDVYAVITYYLWHTEQIERYLNQRREHAGNIRRELEERFPPEGFRDLLLARKHQGG